MTWSLSVLSGRLLSFLRVSFFVLASLGILNSPMLAAEVEGMNGPLAQLKVSRYWSIKAIDLAEVDERAEMGHFLVRSNIIWLGVKYVKPTPYDGVQAKSPDRWGILAWDAKTLSPVMSFPDLPVVPQCQGAFFDLTATHLYTVAGSSRIRRYDLASKQYRDYPVVLPANSPVTLMASANVLLIGAADRLLELDTATGKVKILFSRRRFPVETELDSIDLKAAPVLLHVTERFYDFKLLANEGASSHWSYDRTKNMWSQQSDLAPGGATLVRFGESGRIWGPDGMWVMRNHDEATPVLTSYNQLHAIWKLDAKIPLAGHHFPWNMFFYEGENAIGILPPVSIEKVEKSSNIVADSNHPAFDRTHLVYDQQRRASLWWFDRKWDTALEFDLQFFLPEPVNGFRFTVEGIRGIHTSETDFILPWQDQTYRVPAGFWLISKDEVRNLVSQHAVRVKMKDNAHLALLKRFDTNRNGFLEKTEVKQMEDNPQRLMEQAVQKAKDYIRERDKDGDGMLDEDEMTKAGLLGFHPGLDTINVKSSSIREILTSCDKNQDRKMDQNEAAALFHPSFVFSKRAPLPLSLQKFDLDKDGWLNPQENAAVKRAMEERLKKR